MEQNRDEIVTVNFHFFKIYSKESPMLQKIHIHLERNLLVSETWHTIFLEQNRNEIVTENFNLLFHTFHACYTKVKKT